MFSFYSSERRPLYYSPGIYSVHRDDDLYARYLHSGLPVANPEVRYRRALGEYLAAKEEYNALVDTRKAKLRSHGEALRRERARLRLASLARARQEQRVRQIQQGLAKSLGRAAVSGDDDLSLHHVVPVTFMHQTFETEQPLSDMFDPLVRASCDGFPCWEKEVRGVWIVRSHLVLIAVQEQDDAEETSINQPPSEPQERSVPDLESLLRERLQKIAGDEEVQDLARAILRHLTSVTGVSCPSASASSPEVGLCYAFVLNAQILMTVSKVNACSTEPSEGADLARSHALKGVAAEAAKASFKAHRAEVAERDEPSPSSPPSRTAPSSLSIIRDIRSALARLSDGFSLPSSLDFSDDEPDGLAYTPTNAPVRVYEHALDELLAQLDAVETDGDEEVRVVRRAAVKEVEKAIEDVEKKVREAKESAKPGSNPEITVSAEADHTESKSDHGVVDAKQSVDNDKSEADEPSKPAGRSDSGSSCPKVVPVENPEVALPHVTNPASVLDEDTHKDQSSASVLAPICPVDPVATPLEQVEAVSRDDASESKHKAFGEQVTIDETTSTGLESTPSTPPEFIGVSLPVLGAIARSSTPVAPLLPSTVIAEDLAASLRHDRLSVSSREDDISIGLDDTDEEDEWTEI
jgi:BAG domain